MEGLSRPQSSLPDQQHKHDHDHDRNKHQHQHHDKKDHDKKDRPRYYDRRLEDLKATKATESSDYSYGKDVYGHGHDDHDLAPVVLVRPELATGGKMASERASNSRSDRALDLVVH
ncbi:hypothetical protein PInf_004369 [Phytophthora infestans]|nr:hypothetical protein PInf_004369 [Phytophthora infestans]